MRSVMPQAEPELCSKCGHERGLHYDSVCHHETTTEPYVCMCARFIPKEPQAVDTRAAK